MSNVAKLMPTAIGPLIQFIDKPLYSPPMIPSVLNDDVDFVFVKYLVVHLQIFDWDNMSVTLHWEVPKFDGGRPITHYVIEMKEKNMNQWVEGSVLTLKQVQEMGNMIKGKQTGLHEGCEYQFRVRAVNKGGPSKPSPPSIPMIAKTRFCKIFFTFYNLNLSI